MSVNVSPRQHYSDDLVDLTRFLDSEQFAKVITEKWVGRKGHSLCRAVAEYQPQIA